MRKVKSIDELDAHLEAVQKKLPTIGEVAERFATLDGEFSANYLARQIRGFVQSGVITPQTYRGEGRTAAALLNFVDVCTIRLCCVLAQVGLTTEEIRDAARCMSNFDATMWAGGRSICGMLTTIEAIKNGERVFFVVHRGKSVPLHDSYSAISGSFSKTPNFENPLTSASTFAHIVLDCKELLFPLLDYEISDVILDLGDTS